MKTVIIAGPPGCGKGTQAKLLAEHLGYMHISTGDILRKEIAAGTKLGKIAKARIDDGNFVPDNIACEMVSNFMEENSDIKGVVFDGFPRTVAQCYEFDKMLSVKGKEAGLCVKIDVDENELKNRLLKRNEQSKRPDDSNLEIIEHRIELFKQRTKPVSDYYNNKGLCKYVDGNGNIEEVFNSIVENIPTNY